MTKHGSIVNDLKAVMNLPEAEREYNGKNKALLLKAIVHATDIGNPTRPFEIALDWGKRITKEFFY